MNPEKRWGSVEDSEESVFGLAGMGILRVTLLFGSAAVAMALILAPIVDNQSRQIAGASGVDRMTTGTVRTGGGYTVRRSVLQESPNAICIIRDNGLRSGNC